MAEFPWAELVVLAPALLFAGLIAGVVAGLLGVGGGIVIVPVLFYTYGALNIDDAVRMHVAVGTSLATIIATSISSVRSHHKKGAVDFDLLRSWTPALTLGVLLGAAVAGYIEQVALTLIFATVALFFALNLAFGREEWRLGTSFPTGLVKYVMVGTIGLISALMGIGGGTLGVTTLKLYGYDIRRAVATAAGFGLIISIPGTIGFILGGLGVENRPPFSIGYVNLISVALIMPSTVIAAPWGAKLAHSLDRILLQRIFALFLAVTSVRMYLSVFG